MSVDASMMMNFIQATNANAKQPSAKRNTPSSSNEATFEKLLSNMTSNKSVETLSEVNKLEEIPMSLKKTLEQLLSACVVTQGEEVQKDEESMSALLQLLMQSVDETRKEQFDSEVNADADEAMSLMSMLMNMGDTSLPEEIPTNSELVMVQDSQVIDLSMMQTDTRLNQLLVTLHAMNQQTENVESTNSEIVDNSFMQTMKTVNAEMPITAEQVVEGKEQPITIEVPAMKEMPQEIEKANPEVSFTEDGMKMEWEIVASKENKQSQLNDFEKAYQEMQAYRSPVTPAKVETTMFENTATKQFVAVTKTDVLNQISENMKALNDIQDEFVIKLKPEGLGEIIVKLQSESNGKNILSLVVNNQNVKNVLDSDLQGLKAALSQTNVEVKEVVYDNQSQYFQQSNFMEGNSFYQNRGQSNQANQSQSYQFNDDGQEETMQETVVMQSDSLIHQYV